IPISPGRLLVARRSDCRVAGNGNCVGPGADLGMDLEYASDVVDVGRVRYRHDAHDVGVLGARRRWCRARRPVARRAGPRIPARPGSRHPPSTVRAGRDQQGRVRSEKARSHLSATPPPGHPPAHEHHAIVQRGHAAPGHPGQGAGGHARHHAHMVADFRRRFWVSLALTVPVLALARHIQGWLGLHGALAFPGDAWVQFVLATAIFFYGGWPFLTGLVAEVRTLRPGMMTLIGLAIAVAYVYSSAVVFGLRGEDFFWELATLIDIMLLGHWIETKSVLGASAALESLVRLMPAEAHLIQSDGSTRDVPLTELRRGARVLVKPGEKIPTDGVIVEGHTSVNEAMLTGESRPVEKDQGATVIGGSVNGEGAITVEVAKTGDETYLAQVIALGRQAQESRSRSQDLANRAAVWLTAVALGGGAVTVAAWLVVGASLPFAVERMVTVMVIACPHALGLAVPLVVAVSTALSAGSGLLIRDRSAFERARALDAIVFDKTGTLTEGRFGVTDVIPLGSRSAEDLLRLAASLESQSEHPIAAGVVRGARETGIAFAPPPAIRAN